MLPKRRHGVLASPVPVVPEREPLVGELREPGASGRRITRDGLHVREGCGVHGHVGVRLRRVQEQVDQLLHATLVPADHHQLGAEDQERVGLTRLRPDVQRVLREALRFGGHAACEREHRVEELAVPEHHRPADLGAGSGRPDRP